MLPAATAASKSPLIPIESNLRCTYCMPEEVVFMDKGIIVERSGPQRMFEQPAEARTRSFLERLLEREGQGVLRIDA